LGVNFNTTRITSLAPRVSNKPLLNAQQIAYLTTGTPKNKIIIGGVWHYDKWGVSLHETRYGPTSAQETYYSGPNTASTTVFLPLTFGPCYITDLEVRYDVTRRFVVAMGATNLFNTYPGKLPAVAQAEGNQYDTTTAQIGLDPRRRALTPVQS
jgi:iron complex outermembrane recepter protein